MPAEDYAKIKFEVKALLLKMLRDRGAHGEVADVSVRFEYEKVKHQIGLENAWRIFEQSGSLDAVRAHFENLLQFTVTLPQWPAAKSNVRIAAQPADFDFKKANALHKSRSTTLCEVMVYADEKTGQVRWLQQSDLGRWKINLETLIDQAKGNMARILDAAKFEPMQNELGGFSLDSEFDNMFRASLIFAPNLKAKIESIFGWPVFAILPSRDFLYLSKRVTRETMNTFAEVGKDEYRNSPYPISNEVFRISDAGIEAVGEFVKRQGR